MSEEKKLVRLCKQKSNKAFNKLYDNYAPVLFAICLRYAADKSEAEDILQESFIKIFNNIKRYKSQGSFEGWLKRVTVNTALNYLRTRKRLLYSDEKDKEMNQFIDDKIDAVSQMSENEILNCIQDLPAGYRTIFNMYVIEGYKHAEIAKILNISVNTSRTQLIKARKALQKELERLRIENE